MAVVTHAYRPKRSRKRKAQAALNVPAIVRAGKKGAFATKRTPPSASPVPAATNDDRRSAIVTARKRGGRAVAEVPDMTPEEHKRQGDAADDVTPELRPTNYGPLGY